MKYLFKTPGNQRLLNKMWIIFHSRVDVLMMQWDKKAIGLLIFYLKVASFNIVTKHKSSHPLWSDWKLDKEEYIIRRRNHFENLTLPCYLLTPTGKTKQNKITLFPLCAKYTQGARFLPCFSGTYKDQNCLIKKIFCKKFEAFFSLLLNSAV